VATVLKIFLRIDCLYVQLWRLPQWKLDIIALHDKLTRLPLLRLKSVMLDHFIAKHATAHKANSYHTLFILYCTFSVGKHTF